MRERGEGGRVGEEDEREGGRERVAGGRGRGGEEGRRVKGRGKEKEKSPSETRSC